MPRPLIERAQAAAGRRAHATMAVNARRTGGFAAERANVALNSYSPRGPKVVPADPSAACRAALQSSCACAAGSAARGAWTRRHRDISRSSTCSASKWASRRLTPCVAAPESATHPMCLPPGIAAAAWPNEPPGRSPVVRTSTQRTRSRVLPPSLPCLRAPRRL